MRAQEDQSVGQADEVMDLQVTLDLDRGCFLLEWRRPGATEAAARGELTAKAEHAYFWIHSVKLTVEADGEVARDGCNSRGTSPRALVNRLRKRFPVPDQRVRVCVSGGGTGSVETIALSPWADAWRWLGQQVQMYARLVEAPAGRMDDEQGGRMAARMLARGWLGARLDGLLHGRGPDSPPAAVEAGFELRVTVQLVQEHIRLDWLRLPGGSKAATGCVEVTDRNELTWTLETEGRREVIHTNQQPGFIREALDRWLGRFPMAPGRLTAFSVGLDGRGSERLRLPPSGTGKSPTDWIAKEVEGMAEALAARFGPSDAIAGVMEELAAEDFAHEQRRMERREQKRAQEEARRREALARLAEERRRREQREQERKAARKAAEAKAQPAAQAAAPRPVEHPPLPPVPLHIELPGLEFQETTFPLSGLDQYALRERAALWWVSNQSDNLLCLPHCRIEHLDYQERTALRVLGPLRGRALLSDEVGLGKTIEAGLVLKELLTRGLVKRFLVLTVPSLVDQWAEELSDKFGLDTATTNQAAARGDGSQFWRENKGIIASLHTLKQPAQLEIARQEHWDMLIVDEAHYLRNRESQAWQAVSALPRQFLLLLTATPVQNSLEELYNLVTLLQPGQLPTPKEFRARFIDPKRPRQPRQPEELRRLLGQVMIRTTRATAGLDLPPRRAETVLFEPGQTERGFWERWEAEFRARLAQLNASQASLWGRLLLQAAGSSPMAWREAVQKFPDPAAAREWSQQAPLEESWRRKCELLAPLTRGEGGLVIFTQFLETQSALAEQLRRAGVEAFVINGSTPAPERQPITEAFHRQGGAGHGGALLLTRSGTEGRNLQFSHRLANFDLPWNPMEIEQRIGRLHRLGQKRPVQIYNFVQAGTLQEHLLQILQEKLNLFELVVGETGLVLGERFSSDEFAEEVLRRWRESDGRVAEALAGLGEELAAARDSYGEVKKLDETLFEQDYESI